MFWTGFLAGFASCLVLVIGDYLCADFRRERRERARFMASLTPDDQKRYLAIESMGTGWRRLRELREIEEARHHEEIGLKAKK